MASPTAGDQPVIQLECYPKRAALEQGAMQQVVVTAMDAEGRRWDVTREVVFEGSDREIATIDQTGLQAVAGKPGTKILGYDGRRAASN